jgi:hypothetical protein
MWPRAAPLAFAQALPFAVACRCCPWVGPPLSTEPIHPSGAAPPPRPSSRRHPPPPPRAPSIEALRADFACARPARHSFPVQAEQAPALPSSRAQMQVARRNQPHTPEQRAAAGECCSPGFSSPPPRCVRADAAAPLGARAPCNFEQCHPVEWSRQGAMPMEPSGRTSSTGEGRGGCPAARRRTVSTRAGPACCRAPPAPAAPAGMAVK